MEKEGRVATITLNRPEKLNAINHLMLEELARAIDEISMMPEVGVVIIRGEGRAFSSGTDLQALGTSGGGQGPQARRYALEMLQRPYNSMERLEKPIIARIHGYALGAAMEMILACDFRICSTDTRFSLPEVKYGIIPDLGGCQRLVRVVGLAKAKELVMTGRMIDAEEAMRIGLVNSMVPQDELDNEVDKWVQELLGLPPLAVGQGKRAVEKSLDMDILSALDYTAQVQSMLLESEDFVEAVKARLEKREPSFKGR
jgi:enoyl-CoA hydratase/carnithine racemase